MHDHNSKNLYDQLDKGIKIKFEEIYKILNIYENLLSINNDNTNNSNETNSSTEILCQISLTEEEEIEEWNYINNKYLNRNDNNDPEKNPFSYFSNFDDCMDLYTIKLCENSGIPPFYLESEDDKIIKQHSMYEKNICVSFIPLKYYQNCYLFIYDFNKNEILLKLEGYPVIAKQFCLTHLNDQILIIPCREMKKKLNIHENNKNGLLLVNQNSGEVYFFETSDFSPSCICRIDNYDKIKAEKIYKDFLLVGGYDNNGKYGLINLFGINCSECQKLKILGRVGKKYDENIDCIYQKEDGQIIIVSNNELSSYKVSNLDYNRVGTIIST